MTESVQVILGGWILKTLEIGNWRATFVVMATLH